MHQLLYSQVKSPQYPLGRRLGAFHSQSGTSGKEKNSLPLLGNQTPVIQPIV